MGFVISITLDALMLALNVSVLISAGLTLLFTVSPADVLFGRFLYTTYPRSMFLCLAAFCLAIFLRVGRRLSGYRFLIALVLVVPINSTFQVVWAIIPIPSVYCCARQRFRNIRRGAAVSLTGILLLYLKNALLFGTVTTGS